MSDTPETDAVICCHTKVFGMIGEYVTARFARNLELERDRLAEALHDLQPFESRDHDNDSETYKEKP